MVVFLCVKKFTADFETCVWKEDETWVWAWAVSEIGNDENIIIDNNIDSFIEFCRKEKNSIFYFHNLKFDGEFIIYWALTHGFKHVEDKKEIEDNTFTTLISDMGQFYSITLYFKKKNKHTEKVTFYDSLKIIPFSNEEKDYIKNDVQIMAKALNILFNEELDKMTRASSALTDYKKTIKKSQFERYFPKLNFELDEELRKSYKGGFTYLNPIYKEKDVGKGNVLDVNSLYPSVMYNDVLPFGEPVYYERKI